MSNPYHYTECGLNYIYLENGFRIHETPYGEGVSIDAADQLHEAIALTVISSPRALRGQEVRFLRSLLQVSQSGLGEILGVSRPTIARWESAPDDKISSATADRMLRVIYALKAAGHEVALKILDLLTEIDELEHKIALFQETNNGWREAKAA